MSATQSWESMSGFRILTRSVLRFHEASPPATKTAKPLHFEKVVGSLACRNRQKLQKTTAPWRESLCGTQLAQENVGNLASLMGRHRNGQILWLIRLCVPVLLKMPNPENTILREDCWNQPIKTLNFKHTGTGDQVAHKSLSKWPSTHSEQPVKLFAPGLASLSLTSLALPCTVERISHSILVFIVDPHGRERYEGVLTQS